MEVTYKTSKDANFKDDFDVPVFIADGTNES